jgi:hypothetical protein
LIHNRGSFLLISNLFYFDDRNSLPVKRLRAIFGPKKQH